MRKAWLYSVFSPSEMAATSFNGAAAALVADCGACCHADQSAAALRWAVKNGAVDKSCADGGDGDCCGEIATAIELAAVSVSQAHAFRQPVPLGRHSYRGGSSKPDCVEQCAREVLGLMLWDGERFEVGRLPSSADSRIRAFFEAENSFRDPASSSAVR